MGIRESGAGEKLGGKFGKGQAVAQVAVYWLPQSGLSPRNFQHCRAILWECVCAGRRAADVLGEMFSRSWDVSIIIRPTGSIWEMYKAVPQVVNFVVCAFWTVSREFLVSKDDLVYTWYPKEIADVKRCVQAEIWPSSSGRLYHSEKCTMQWHKLLLLSFVHSGLFPGNFLPRKTIWCIPDILRNLQMGSVE